VSFAGSLFAAALAASGSLVAPANIIDGADDRGSLLTLGPTLGLSAEEIARIRKVSGHVGCFEPRPQVASGALYLADDLVLTAAHTFFAPDGKRAGKCFFRPQAPGSDWMPLLTDRANARFGAVPPKPGSNNDWAIVRLASPIVGAQPFPPASAPPVNGEALIVVTAHPAGMETMDPNVPVVQGCKVRRVPKSSSTTNFYRSDCDATGASSGGMHLSRVGGQLMFRGITISTGPWRDSGLAGAPYDEKAGSVTTALGTDAAILAAGRELAATK
jgi:Trypsin-like peptidase domain